MKLSFIEIYGNELIPYIEKLSHLRIKVFREFPYLYDGSLDYEKEYLKTYSSSKNSYVILVFDNEKLVGASTAILLKDADYEMKEPIIREGFKEDKVLYFGESILLKEYRGIGIGKKFFLLREKFAKGLKVRHCCFYSVKRSLGHKLIPKTYRELSDFWDSQNFYKSKISCEYEWKDIDKIVEDKKTMILWIKTLS